MADGRLTADHGPTANDQGTITGGQRPVERAAGLVAAIIMLGAFGVRVPGLAGRPLWFDEGYSVYFASVPPLETARLTAIDIHPPLYYWFLQVWTLLVGWNPVSIRFASVVVGVLTVAALVPLARRLRLPWAGLLAAGWLAISPLHVAYSQEIRMYALFTLCGVLSVAALSGVTSRRTALAVYVLSTAAALLTQYYAVFLVAGQTVWVLLDWLANRGDRPGGRIADGVFRQRVAALMLVCLPFVAWSLFAAGSLLNYVRGKVAFEAYTPLDPWSFLSHIVATFAGAGPLTPLAAVFLVLLVAAGLTSRTDDSGGWVGQRLLAAVIGTGLLGAYALNVVSPFHPENWERVVLFLLPFVLLAASSGLVCLLAQSFDREGEALGFRNWRFWWSLSGAALLVLLLAATALTGLAAYYTKPPADDPRPWVRQVATLGRPSDLLLAAYPWQIGYLRYYAEGPVPDVALIPTLDWPANPDRDWTKNPEALSRDLAKLLAGRTRVWLPAFQKQGRILESLLEEELARRFFLASESWYADHRLVLYGTGPADKDAGVAARFGQFDLRATRLGQLDAESATGVSAVSLDWTSTLTQSPEIHLRLADGPGLTWGQHDRTVHLVAGGTRTNHGLLVPAGTPPGRYRLLLSVTAGGGPVTAIAPDGRVLGPEVELGLVTVRPATAQPPVDALFIERPAEHDIGRGVRLLGTSFDPGPYRTGEFSLLTLFWQGGDVPAGQDATVRLGGAAVTAPIGGGYPASGWRPGELVRELRRIPVRAAQSGSVELTLEIGGQRVVLGQIIVNARTKVDQAPAVQIRSEGRFGQVIDLLGASLEANGRPVDPGQLPRELDIDLVWRTAAETDQDLAVFVHLLGPDGRPVAQHDSRPANGTAPTAGWSSGEVIVDRHRLVIPASAPPGEYRIAVGLYPPPTGARLPVQLPGGGTGDAIIVTAVTLR